MYLCIYLFIYLLIYCNHLFKKIFIILARLSVRLFCLIISILYFQIQKESNQIERNRSFTMMPNRIEYSRLRKAQARARARVCVCVCVCVCVFKYIFIDDYCDRYRKSILRWQVGAIICGRHLPMSSNGM